MSEDRPVTLKEPLPCCAMPDGEHADNCRTPIFAKLAADRATRREVTLKDLADERTRRAENLRAEGAKVERERIIAIIEAERKWCAEMGGWPRVQRGRALTDNPQTLTVVLFVPSKVVVVVNILIIRGAEN